MNDEYNSSKNDSSPQTEQLFRIKHRIKNPNFFAIDKVSNDLIANHKKNYLFLIKCDLLLIFNKDFLKPIHIETDFYSNTNPSNLKRYLLYQIDKFIEKGHMFSYIDEMNITILQLLMIKCI